MPNELFLRKPKLSTTNSSTMINLGDPVLIDKMTKDSIINQIFNNNFSTEKLKSAEKLEINNNLKKKNFFKNYKGAFLALPMTRTKSCYIPKWKIQRESVLAGTETVLQRSK